MNRFKTGLIISGILAGAIYLYMFITHIYADIYHKQFSADSLKKVEIEIYSNYTNEEMTVVLTAQEEIEFFRHIFVNELENNSIKEKKLYDYSVILIFYSLGSAKSYVYEVFFDHEKLPLRPVILNKKGNKYDPGGYPFILKDVNFKFHEKIMSYWNQAPFQ